MTHITKGGWAGYGQMMETLFSCDRWKKNTRFELENFNRIKKWWPENRGREIPRGVVLYHLNRIANCRRMALRAHVGSSVEG